jgi:hypothetical protein
MTDRHHRNAHTTIERIPGREPTASRDIACTLSEAAFSRTLAVRQHGANTTLNSPVTVGDSPAGRKAETNGSDCADWR